MNETIHSRGAGSIENQLRRVGVDAGVALALPLDRDRGEMNYCSASRHRFLDGFGVAYVTDVELDRHVREPHRRLRWISHQRANRPPSFRQLIAGVPPDEA